MKSKILNMLQALEPGKPVMASFILKPDEQGSADPEAAVAKIAHIIESAEAFTRTNALDRDLKPRIGAFTLRASPALLAAIAQSDLISSVRIDQPEDWRIEPPDQREFKKGDKF